MAKVKVAEASGMVLDYMVARCDQPDWTEEDALLWIQNDEYKYHPSTNWSQGGAIIEREKIEILPMFNPEGWSARVAMRSKWLDAPTPLIAAMRCYAISELGPEVEVPNELLEE